MTDVAAIILAAGISRRMGQKNKLLLPVGDIPMIRHMVLTYQFATTCPVLVVTGHDHTALELAIEGTGAETAFNHSFLQGQQTSVACGLAAVRKASLILIGLGDQPLLKTDDLTYLLESHAGADPMRISIPVLGQVRGNPIVVPGSLKERLLADEKTPGCRAFTRAHPKHVQFHELTSSGFYADVDTPDQYSAMKSRILEQIP